MKNSKKDQAGLATGRLAESGKARALPLVVSESRVLRLGEPRPGIRALLAQPGVPKFMARIAEMRDFKRETPPPAPRRHD